MIGVAAVAGLGMLVWLRKTAATTETAGAAGLVGSGLSSSSGWAGMPITVNTKPLPVSDAAPRNAAPTPAPTPVQGGAAATGGRFVAGPAGGGNGDRGEFWYSLAGPNGMMTATVDDPGQIQELRDIRTWVQDYNVNDPTQVQSMFDQGRATGRSYDEVVSDLAAATGYYSTDVGKVASGAGVAKW